MLLFTKKGGKKCDCNFFIIFAEKDLGDFSVDILSNRCQQKNLPKSPKYFIVRRVTIHAARIVNGRNTSLHLNIKNQQIQHLSTKKYPTHTAVKIVGIHTKNELDYGVITKNAKKRQKSPKLNLLKISCKHKPRQICQTI